MTEQRYILQSTTLVNYNGNLKEPPALSGEFVKDRALFFDQYAPLNFLEKDWVFDFLLPMYSDEEERVDFICDFHEWTQYKPNLNCNPVSERMKKVLDQHVLYPNKFYEAKVNFKNELRPYFIWQFFLDGFDRFVDFEHSRFCEKDWEGELGTEIIKVNNLDELWDIRMEKNWDDWGFHRAVMKPEYKKIDCAKMAYPYGIVISERLKNALEKESDLNGFEIIPFPVEFEYL